ncbi:aldehyde dehydrogenase family protein [Bacillus tianshenii]|nr:aldehyde dehydrogenase family protein [Bacillus tianshenii]
MMNAQTITMKMLVAGSWVDRTEKIEVRDPQNNDLIATIPKASREDVLSAIEAAKAGAETAAEMPVHQRITILNKVAQLLEERQEEFARTISREGSKTINEARGEVKRSIETLRISAEEARRIRGETIPFSQMPGSENRIGYYYRFPVGVIAAITPFNDPLNLVAHKIGPAIASGNAVIIKPASATPLSALKLAELFVEAGIPEKILTVITGSGREIGEVLVSSDDIQMISFTGGVDTGLDISSKAGIKKMGMELGSNSPAIVLRDANLTEAIDATISGAFSAAGQNCIGVQRIYIEREVFDTFTEQFTLKAKQFKTGDKQSTETDMGPMINEKEAQRVESWVNEAIEKGAILHCGGKRNGAFFEPTVLSNVPVDCIIANEEVFGPVVLLYSVYDLEEAIERSNAVNYGLQAGIFTSHLDKAFKAVQKLHVGGVMINDSSDYRMDSMPFGGVKNSGLGREGVRFAIEEMTEPKVVCLNLSQ